MKNNVFGEKLLFYRKKLNLTQAELAEMLNINQVTIANYERGVRFPRKEILIKLAESLGVSLDTLLGEPSKTEIISQRREFSLDVLLNILRREPIGEAKEYVSEWEKLRLFSQAEIFSEIFVPLLRLTGEKWFRGDLLISEEHIISDKIRELILTTGSNGPEMNEHKTDNQKRWMGLCLPGEEHELGLLMNARLMISVGWKIYYLGKNIPFSDLRRMVELYSPKILAISATMNENSDMLISYIKTFREVFGKTPAIICGGKAAVEKRKSLSGLVDGIARSIEDGRNLSIKIYNSTGENE